MKKVLMVLMVLQFVFVSCNKDEISEGKTIIGKWAESSTDETYSEIEHISFIEFRNDGTVKVIYDGNLPFYVENGPETIEYKYTFDTNTNNLYILSNDPNDTYKWAGTVVFKDENSFSWTGSIYHRL